MQRNIALYLLLIVLMLTPLVANSQDKSVLGQRPYSNDDIILALKYADSGGPITGCLYKMERYGGLRGDNYDNQFRNYDLALEAGRKCIDTGVEKTPAGWLVHLWMAFFLKETGQIEPANKHLAAAFELDWDGNIQQLSLLARYGFKR